MKEELLVELVDEVPLHLINLSVYLRSLCTEWIKLLSFIHFIYVCKEKKNNTIIKIYQTYQRNTSNISQFDQVWCQDIVKIN